MYYDYSKSSCYYHVLYSYLELAKQMRITSEKILDVGCGFNHLKRVYANLIGIDIAKNSKADILGDCHMLPFRDKSFDISVSVGVIEHVKDPVRMIEEMVRVTKRRIGIVAPNRFAGRSDPRHLREYTIFELIRLMRKYGKILDWGYGGFGKRFRFKNKYLKMIVNWLIPRWISAEWIAVTIKVKR